MMMKAEEIVLPDRTIYCYKDGLYNSYGASFIEKSQLIDVKGNIDKDIMIKIVSNIDIK